MANANAPRGLVPYADMTGKPYSGAVRTYYVPAANATALYIGDPVQLVTNTSDGNGIPVAEIGTAAGGNYILGAFMGRSNNAGQATIPVQSANNVYLPAAIAAYIYVCDDPDLLYWAQEDSVGGSMVSGASGRNVDLIAGAGSTYSGYSGWMLDSSTLAVTNTLQFRIIQMLQQADNALGTNAKWLGKLNLAQMRNPLGI